MEIYVRVHSNDGSILWWNSDGYQSYFMDGKDLMNYDGEYGDYCRGTPFKTVKQARKEARTAVNLAVFDGIVDPKATFWRFVNGKLVQTKFTRDGKIKK